VDGVVGYVFGLCGCGGVVCYCLCDSGFVCIFVVVVFVLLLLVGFWECVDWVVVDVFVVECVGVV